MPWGDCPAVAPRLAPPPQLAGAARGEYLESLALRAMSLAAAGAARADCARLGLLAAGICPLLFVTGDRHDGTPEGRRRRGRRPR